MYQALNDINLENVSVNVEQKEIIRNIIALKRRRFGESLIFQLVSFVFAPNMHRLFNSLVSPLMSDQTAKQNDLQVSSLMLRKTESRG